LPQDSSAEEGTFAAIAAANTASRNMEMSMSNTLPSLRPSGVEKDPTTNVNVGGGRRRQKSKKEF
jgi:hypothetical protein